MKKIKTKQKVSTNKSDPQVFFSVDADSLGTALDKLNAVVPMKPNECFYGFYLHKKTVRLIGHTNDKTICIELKVTRVQGEGDFYFLDPVTLRASVRGRKEIDIAFDSMLHFSSGNYRGTLKLLDGSVNEVTATDIKIGLGASLVDQDKSFNLDDKLFSALSEGVKATRLKDPYSDYHVPTASIQFNGKSLVVLSYDDWHMHVFKAEIKSKSASFSLHIPTAIFALLDRVIKDDVKFYTANDYFFIRSGDVTISLPPIDSERDIEQVLQFFNSMKDPAKQFKLDKKFTAAITNITGYVKKGISSLLMSSKGAIIDLNYQNDNGSVSDTIEVKKHRGKDFNGIIDPIVFDDSYKLLKTEPSILFSVFLNHQKVPAFYKMECDYKSGYLETYGYFKS